MNASRFISAATLFLAASLAQAATVTGTVIDKTTGKPAAGDTVVLVDVQAGMSETAHATTDGKGFYTLKEPGSGPYLFASPTRERDTSSPRRRATPPATSPSTT